MGADVWKIRQGRNVRKTDLYKQKRRRRGLVCQLDGFKHYIDCESDFVMTALHSPFSLCVTVDDLVRPPTTCNKTCWKYHKIRGHNIISLQSHKTHIVNVQVVRSPLVYKFLYFRRIVIIVYYVSTVEPH